jgi:hypothetical protein
MKLVAGDPHAVFYDVYLWDGTQWQLQEACLEAEDGDNGFVRVEVQDRRGVRVARYFGSVRFIRKPLDIPNNPPGWGKRTAPHESNRQH